MDMMDKMDLMDTSGHVHLVYLVHQFPTRKSNASPFAPARQIKRG